PVLSLLIMPSRFLVGISDLVVLPRFLKGVLRSRRTPYAGILFSTLLAGMLVLTVSTVLHEETIAALGGTTALRLLTVFGLVNISILVLRGEPGQEGHYRTPTALPVIGALTSFALVSPLTQPTENYAI